MKWIGMVAVAILATACTTAPTVEAPANKAKINVPAEPVQNERTTIDYVSLQRAMGMEIPAESLGYKEKAFDTCQAGYGYSSVQNCHKEYMVVINIRLQCRDSEGTVAEGVSNADLTAIANRPVRWNLKPNQGVTNTDSDGFAQIMTVSARSPKTERLKISVGNEFLYMRANEITRVVTPRPWCNQ
jgi:hypothetical protein